MYGHLAANNQQSFLLLVDITTWHAYGVLNFFEMASQLCMVDKQKESRVLSTTGVVYEEKFAKT